MWSARGSAFDDDTCGYVGVVIELTEYRIRVLRKAKTFQIPFGVRTPPLRLGCWICMTVGPNGIFTDVEVIDPPRNTKCNDDGEIWMRTVAVVADCPEQKSPYEQRIWSPDFEWLADPDGLFDDDVNVDANVAYDTWVTMNDESNGMPGRPLLMVVDVLGRASDQMAVVDTPWAKAQQADPGDSTYLVTHSLQQRDKSKVNDVVVYTGLAVCCEPYRSFFQAILWSRASGIARFRTATPDEIPVGSWVDFSVRSGTGRLTSLLFAHKVVYSKNLPLRTRVVNGKAQVCETMRLPEGIAEKDGERISDVVGSVWFESVAVVSRLPVGWVDLPCEKVSVWLSADIIYGDIRWKFDSFATPQEIEQRPSEAADRFSDLLSV